MNIESVRQYCLQLKGAEESLPFGPDNLVYKVGGKIFAISGLDEEECSVNLKCDPERASELRELHPEHIYPGYHMNKKHWNTVIINGSIPDNEVQRMIDNSYSLIVKKLGKSASHLL